MLPEHSATVATWSDSCGRWAEHWCFSESTSASWRLSSECSNDVPGAAELADPASLQLLGFLTKSGRVAFGLPASYLVRNVVLIGLTASSVRVQTRTRSIDVTTSCSSARAIDFDVNEGVFAATPRIKSGIEIECGIGTVRTVVMPRGRGGIGFMSRAEVSKKLSALEVNTAA